MESLTKIDRTTELTEHLKDRGIGNIEVGERTIITRKLIDLIDPKSPKYDEIRGETLKVLDELGISPETEIEFEEFEISFDEDVSRSEIAEIFPDRPTKQKFKAYILKSRNNDLEQVYGIFSGGGTIRQDTSTKSAFAPLIYEEAQKEGKNFSLILIDHRGSDSDTNKQNYTLYDRGNDLAVAQLALTSKKIDPSYNENAKIVHIGNSTGGHVEAVASSYLKPDAILLSQPAAFSKPAETAPWGQKYSEAIRVPESWRESFAFESVQGYLQAGGKLLVIGAKEDEVIPDTVIKRYISKINDAYLDAANEVKGKAHAIGYMWIPVGHYLTSKYEIQAITNSF